MKTIIYLHGFNSSANSEKACLTRGYFQNLSDQELSDQKLSDQKLKHGLVTFNVVIPTLPPEPLKSVHIIDKLIRSVGCSNIAGFIGSSLGGYLSLYFQQRFSNKDNDLKVVLINPAVRPYELLTDYLGENENPYTGERYRVEPSHMEDLKSLSVISSATAKNTFLLSKTGDEVLDFQQAISHLSGAKMWIQSGGNHAFENYFSALPAIYNFFLDGTKFR